MKTKLFFLSLIITFSSFAQLTGNYTIGGTDPDYATFLDATTALSTDGVSGPVIFNVRSGTYIEQIILNHYVGTSEINTITFQAETQNADDVLIYLDSTNPNIIQLDNADYIILKYLSITANGNRKAIDIISKVKEISVENCIFNLVDGSALYRNNYYDSVAGNHITSIIFKNNTVNQGLNGIYIRSGIPTYTKNIEISNNTFNDIRKYPIRIDRSGREYDIDGNYIGETGSTIILNNKIITQNGTMSDFTGIYLLYSVNEATIANNLIFYRNSGNAGNIIGIHESNCGSYNGSIRQYWYNNVVDLDAVPSSNRILTGLKIQNGNRQNFVHNTFKLNGSDHIYGIHYTHGGGDNIIQNNDFQILMATPFSYVFVSNDTQNPTSSIAIFDNNNYYHLGDDFAKWLGTELTTFQDYKTITGFDTNSVTQETDFLISDENQVYSCNSLNSLGSFVDYVTVDYNGATRATDSSTIGAISSPLALQLTNNNGVLETSNFINTNAGNYTWYLDNDEIATTTANNFTPLALGDYEVRFEPFGSCDLISNTVTVTVLGTNNTIIDNYKIYPNPVKDVLIINTSEKIEKVVVYSIFGEKVREVEVTNNQIDLSNIDSGIYFLKINNTTQKIIKE
jgi:hypothetical protein